jgi:hypothetical protein
MAKPKEVQDVKKSSVFWGAFFGAIAGYFAVLVILMLIGYFQRGGA